MARLATLAAAAALTLLGCADAYAAGWTTPIALMPQASAAPGDALEVADSHVVVNTAGAQAITWDDYDVGADTRSCITGEATTRVPGSDWAPPVQVGCNADIQIGPGGTAVTIWAESAPGGEALSAATAQAGSSFGQAQAVDTESGASHDGRVAAVDPQGHVTIAWMEYRPQVPMTTYDIYAKTQNSDGTWPAGRQAVEIGATLNRDANYTIALAVGPHGDAVIGLPAVAAVATGKSVVVYTRLTPQGSWVKQTLKGPDPNLYLTPPVIAFDPQDRATLMDAVQTTSPYHLLAWSRPADSTTWGTEQTVTPAEGSASYTKPTLAFDSVGNAEAAFGYFATAGNTEVRTARRTGSSTTWTSYAQPQVGPVPCYTNGALPSPLGLTFDPLDNATLSFGCSDGPHIFTRAAGASGYSAFQTPPGATAPQIVTDPSGYLIATWTANGVTYTSVYDAVAPSIDSVTPPTAPVAGQPTAFTVGGSDVWGPVTFSVDFGDGSPPATGRVTKASGFTAFARATVSNSVSHTYSGAGAYTATITVTDNAANSATTTRGVTVVPAAVVPPAPVLPPVTGLPDPVAGLTVNIAPVKPVVLVKVPGAKTFVPLTAPAQVRVGSIIDTRKGRVRITIDNGHGGFGTADFYQGLFKILQRKATTAIASMQLTGGSFKGCPRAPKAQIAKKRGGPNRSVRHLWGSGNGAFRTVGRFSSATIRGTTWLTDDRCPGTLTKVTAGKVAVRDFVKRKTIIVKKGHSYLAKPRSKR